MLGLESLSDRNFNYELQSQWRVKSLKLSSFCFLVNVFVSFFRATFKLISAIVFVRVITSYCFWDKNRRKFSNAIPNKRLRFQSFYILYSGWKRHPNYLHIAIPFLCLSHKLRFLLCMCVRVLDDPYQKHNEKIY